MSSGGPPGSSSENMLYTLMIGAVIAGGSVYTYKVLHKDKARYNERVAEIMGRPKSEWTAKEWRPKQEDESVEVQFPDVVGTSEEASESATEEVKIPTAESVVQAESSALVVEPNESPLEGKAVVEKAVIEVLPPPASVKEPDDDRSVEMVEASEEATESGIEEIKVPTADSIEQPHSPSTVVEPTEIQLERETKTSIADQKDELQSNEIKEWSGCFNAPK
ncbi:probable serine/threonine-protein kinase kinX [Rhincodon typus]|uniref:probable serine/threonine-protein kinase kinX n=1 Tax=Rhincodon typus TaxID=259920 RepID=UPI002030C99A|nr:probable serine/threonine-protein kinase kinX [Rhincodon typus]